MPDEYMVLASQLKGNLRIEFSGMPHYFDLPYELNQQIRKAWIWKQSNQIPNRIEMVDWDGITTYLCAGKIPQPEVPEELKEAIRYV